MTKNGKFLQAENLYAFLGGCILSDGRKVRDAFRLVGKVSLWDCLSSYLILYRFPLCIHADDDKFYSYKDRVRPILGTLSNIYDTFISPPKYTKSGLDERLIREGANGILLLGFNEPHFRDVLRSVYSAIKIDASLYKPIVLTSTREWKYEESHLSVWDCFSDEVISDVAHALGLVGKLKQDMLHMITTNCCKSTEFLIDWDLVKLELSWICNKEVPRLIYLAASVNEILTRYIPSLIILADDADQRSKLVELAARKAGIPSLVIQQGYAIAAYPDWRHFAGDYVASMSSASLEIIVEQGVPRQAVTITGHPGFDKLKNVSQQDILATRAALGIGKHHFFLLFATQPYVLGAFESEEARDRIIKVVCETASSIKGVILVVKAHPYDNVPRLKRLCKHCKNVKVVDSKTEIADLIKACDIFMTMFSQATLEALYADKPVINIKFPEILVSSPFYDGKATLVLRTNEEIKSEIVNICSGNSTFFSDPHTQISKREMLSNWVYLPDGMATDRVVSLTKKILKHH